MSKVKIQGNASGTGVLTVTAPNTSTDRTITLPDATGTLATTDDNGSQLDHSGSKKIEATSTGVDVIGIAVTDGITSSGNITFDNGNSSVSIKSDGTNGSYIQFGSNEYLRFLYDNGASESIRLIDGGGITFNGDTAAANALDDYEEGTWTPTIVNGGTITTVNAAVYTKVGNVVSFQLYANNISITNNASTFEIGGLPFQPMNSPNTYGGGEVGYVGGFNWAQYAPSFLVNPGGSKIYWQRLNGTSSVVTQANVQGLTVIILSGVYHTNS